MNKYSKLSLVVLLFPAYSFAHGGGLDSYGCHNDNQAGNYHCHQGPLDGLTFPDKESGIAAYNDTNNTDSGSNTDSTINTSYNRDDYLPDWADADGDCQDTRQEVLIIESIIPVVYVSGGCHVSSGLWHDPYTGESFTDPSDVDIDHLVPLAEAHRSGASAWTTEQKRAFANDITNPKALIAVDDGTNQSKSDRDPAIWLPPNEDYHCQYVQDWVAVKQQYGLSMDSDEEQAVNEILAGGSAIPSEIDAVQFSATNAVFDNYAYFHVGMTRTGFCGYRDEASNSESVSITAEIYPDTDHLGLKAEIFVVDRKNLLFTMQNEDGIFQSWTGRVPDLVPFQTGVTLTDELLVEVFSGTLGESGDHRFFVGYLPAGGELVYTPIPVRLNITE